MATDRALLAVEAELARQNSGFHGPVAEVCRYATEGGRRVRAALLLGAADRPGPEAVLAATAVEMLHAATLLQDDIFDAGIQRRGRASAQAQFGKALAVLASDSLLIRSLELAADVHPHFFRSLAQAGRSMAEAEGWELAPPPIHALATARTLALCIAKGKTAALFASTLCGAATLRTLSPPCCRSWEHLGAAMGMTYQLVDDCMDVYGDQRLSGKALRSDLALGRLTLPILLAVAAVRQRHHIEIPLASLQTGRLSAPHEALLHNALASPHLQERLFRRALHRLRGHCGAGLRLGIAGTVLDHWTQYLSGKLAICFPALTVGPASTAAAAPHLAGAP